MSKRGGARPGAGRPVGAKSEIERKYYSFRLTKREHELVKNFLGGIKMENKMYIVRATTSSEAGWMDVASFVNLAEAEKEFENQLAYDKRENDTSMRTQIVDENYKVIKEFTGEDFR